MTQACQSLRTIDMCVIEGQSASCAVKDKKYSLTLDQMRNWHAWDEISNDLLGSKLVECEIKGKLPITDDTLGDMNICLIGIDCKDLDGWIATDRVGFSKIKHKLEFCRNR